MPKTATMNLSEPQLAMLKAFARFEEKNGRAPSLRDLAPELGYADHSGAQRVMEKLEGLGLISPRQVIERGITAKGRKFLP